jgi:hypothetical protein
MSAEVLTCLTSPSDGLLLVGLDAFFSGVGQKITEKK